MLASLSAIAAIALTTTCSRPPPPHVVDCVLPIADPEPPPIEPPPVQPIDSRVPRACLQYGEAIDVLVRCPAIPSDSREALRDAWAAAQQAWGNVGDEAIPALEDACTAGRDAVKKAATQLCPDLAQY